MLALREAPLKTGPCDYLLLVDRMALGVVEAKKMGKDVVLKSRPEPVTTGV